jgi:hypothetical protein
MATKLTNEQRNDIAANPHQAVPVVDDQADKVYYIVDEDFLLGAGEHDEESRQRLRALIQEGIDGPHVSREVGDARIRGKMQQYADKSA